jgi:hypothetical protein
MIVLFVACLTQGPSTDLFPSRLLTARHGFRRRTPSPFVVGARALGSALHCGDAVLLVWVCTEVVGPEATDDEEGFERLRR